MGFAPALWFEEDRSAPHRGGAASSNGGLADKVERLFEIARDPKTGGAYTSAKVARMSLGDLTEEGIEKIRSGALTDPTLGCVIALARAFGVEPSYLVDGGGSLRLGGRPDLERGHDPGDQARLRPPAAPGEGPNPGHSAAARGDGCGRRLSPDNASSGRAVGTETLAGVPTPRGPEYRDPPSRKIARRSPPETSRRGRSTPRPP